MKDKTVTTSPPISVTAHSGIDSKKPQSSIAVIIALGRTDLVEPLIFASSPPVVDASAAAVTQVWTYIGELVFNMLVLVGTIKMSDRVVREMMGL